MTPPHPPINFQFLGRSRPRLQAGDVFTMRLVDGQYLFGRVIRTDAACFGPGCVLIYVFKYRSDSPEPPSRLLVEDLLLPPYLVNRLGWSRGYFKNVESRSFANGELMGMHYFRDQLRPGQFKDEDLEPVPSPPRGVLVGWSGLGNYRTLDDDVSDALGIPRAADT